MKKSTDNKKEFIHIYGLLMLIMLVCAALTYIIPSGEYDMIEVNGVSMMDQASFHLIEGQNISIMGFFSAIHTGMVNTASIIFFVFIVGGSFEVLKETAALESAISVFIKKLGNKQAIMVPVLTLVFCALSSFVGCAEELIPFVPIMVSLALLLGYDTITGVGIVLIAMGAGYGGAVINMFTIGTAQTIAELPLFSGMGYRIMIFAALTSVSVIYITKYAMKIKKNPTLSSTYEMDMVNKEHASVEQDVNFGMEKKATLIVFLLTMVVLVVGVLKFQWYITEIAGLFLIMALLIGAVSKMGVNKTFSTFGKGMQEIAGGALVVGFAAAVLVVLQEGAILDTILYYISNLLVGLPSYIAAVGIYVFQCVLNFLVPSGSGQAALSMPILAPLADMVGVTRQTACIAFQLGDGLSNVLTPTSGILMASLSMAKLSWNKWVKFFLPLIGIQYIIGLIFVLVANYIQLGPF